MTSDVQARASGAPAYDDWDDASLVGRSTSGDDDAFAVLVRRYQGPLFRHALRLTPDRRLAEDVVQEAFLTAWRRLPTLQDPAAFRGWLYQITTRRSIDAFRALKPELPVDTADQSALDLASTGAGPEGRAELRAQLGDLAAALQALPAGQRAAWSMREIDGLSYEEVAVALGVPVSTVRGRIARARAELVERMASWQTTRD
ncbi:RNA polymerase, sigma subunit, ECF family [Microlunatus sagamiharensis]|uniref:RNA polymerase, sigma subunit, ECF family n=1 Tax=Microlunatus sagamiharensis TaxID=546874 RepID=A0A1H2M9K5_9ACTN|nr:sigma-70 family RNA polymerase sigma factor [Microlunatus sagamiharensis]SDU89802.1 RNA polymerase, sigma subunit, ECF family [Microlunatus sagamiharensis]